MTPPLNILVVDDHSATREGLRLAIAGQADLHVVGEAATWHAALRLAQALRPDVVVLDLNLPDGNGWTLIDQLKLAGALPKVLVLSVCDEGIYARRLLRAGARGYLMKDEPMARVLQAIRDIAQGQLVASPALTKQFIQEALGGPDEAVPREAADRLGELSDRELQIFALLGRGERNKEIASRLGLSEKSVATYKVRLMKKIGVSTTPELIQRFSTWGNPVETPAFNGRPGEAEGQAF